MKFSFCYYVAFLVFFISFCFMAGESNSSPVGDPIGDPIELLQKSFDSRKSIKKVHAIIRTRYSGGDGAFSEREYHFLYDEENKRFFFDLPNMSEEFCTCFSDDKNLLAVLSINKNSTLLQSSANPKVHIDLKGRNAMSIEQTGERLAMQNSEHHKIVFPQFEFFGYAPTTILGYRRTDFHNIVKEQIIPFSRLPNVSVSASTVTHKAQSMFEFRVDSTNEAKTQKTAHRSILDPSKKLFPVYVADSFSPCDRVTGEIIGTNTVDSISTIPALHEPSGCWYPTRWVYERHQKGQLMAREEVEVNLISLNEPIDRNLYTLKGLERLTPDTPVTWRASSPLPPAKGSLIWDGETIIGGLPGRGLSEDFSSKPHRWFSIVIVNVIVLSLICGIHFYRRYCQAND